MTARRSPTRRAAFVDTSGYFALLNDNDASHRDAVAVRDRLIAERWRLFTTNLILAETHALLLARLGRRVAASFLAEIEQGPTTLIWSTPADLQRAKAIIYRYDDKDFSLTDATSFAVMERLGILYAFTFDSDFARYGLPSVTASSS